ncbi:hypothetical protein ACLB2K_007141 [Fragaria x ananassa]
MDLIDYGPWVSPTKGVVRFGKKGKLVPSSIKVNADATFVVEPVRIFDRSTKRLQRKEVELVKVCWSHHDEGDASWELESNMRAEYPKLFLD